MSDTTEIAGTLAGLKALDEETIAALQAQLDEEIRLNAMGSEREARLMARLAECEHLRATGIEAIRRLNTEIELISVDRDTLRAQLAETQKHAEKSREMSLIDLARKQEAEDKYTQLLIEHAETQKLLEVQLAVGDKLTAEVARLQGEVVKRNQRALDGDKLVNRWNAEYDRAERLEAELAALREALEEVDKWDIRWADGLDSNVERIKSIVRDALGR